MKVLVVGGGPAGLYFSLLLKRRRPDADVEVLERNAPDATFGWGVVFSGKTLENLGDWDRPSYQDIARAYESWDNVDVAHKSERISIGGNRFFGISRLVLLNILQRHCSAAGVRLRFHQEFPPTTSFPSHDLVLAADGVNSTLRRALAPHFHPTVQPCRNRYAWYGTPRLFHGLTLTFRPTPHGLFIAHSYKFSKAASTFIVECDPDTWKRAGLDTKTDPEARQYLQEVFKEDLEGKPLLSNKSTWLNFQFVCNGKWSHENVVLMGDALHTAHFSIGSGTKLALEDSIALIQSLEGTGSVREALEHFEKTRRPETEETQRAAVESMHWFENAGQLMGMAPVELAYTLMTRSGKIDEENLRKRDAGFVAKYEAWKEAKG